MASIKEFMSQVEMLGSIFQGHIQDMRDLDDIINRLKKFWKDEEVLILCGRYTVDMIQRVLNEYTGEGVTYELETPTFSSLMCEGSFFRGGLTFHMIEKPKMGRNSLWISTNKDATAGESLIVKAI